MGLRNWVTRPIKGRHIGVEDLTTGGSGIPEMRRRRWTLATIDSAPFQIWVVIVAGIGFLTDAFGLFALNVVTPMLGYVYWSTDSETEMPSVPSSVKTAMMCSTLAGTMIGQIGFGFAADILGRRKMYGLELVIIIVGSMLLLMSSTGAKNSMEISGWLITWRAVMGKWHHNHHTLEFADIFRFIEDRVGADCRNSRGTLEDTAHYFGAPEASLEFGEAEMLHIPTRTTAERICSNPSSSSSVIAPEEIIRTDSDSESQPGDAYSQPSAAQSAPFSPGEPEFVPPLASWEDAKNFFITEKNWQYLLGTSLAWLFLDFAFVVSIGTVVGGLLMIKIVKYVSPKVIQFWGFLKSSRSSLVVLYVLSHIAFNLGPNVTTFIIPAEIFPTRYRCTCHGIAAASGKLGSWVVQIFLEYSFQADKGKSAVGLGWRQESFGHILQVMSAFMVAGAVATYFLIPETRDHDNKSRTLEVLACGKKVIDELNRRRKKEDEDE
ncbi:aat family amino acid transporter [Stemphylium lycopersici]|nr:aat family amino acid transporter [Stemphylium lycopersici]